MLLHSSSMQQSPRRETSNPNTEILKAAAIAKKWKRSSGIEISRSSEIPFATRALQGWRREKKVHSWIENQNLHLQLLQVLTIVHFSTKSQAATERHQNFTSQRPYSSPPIFTENTRFLSKPSWHPKAFFSFIQESRVLQKQNLIPKNQNVREKAQVDKGLRSIQCIKKLYSSFCSFRSFWTFPSSEENVFFYCFLLK